MRKKYTKEEDQFLISNYNDKNHTFKSLSLKLGKSVNSVANRIKRLGIRSRDKYIKTTKKFIEECIKIHGNLYDYSLVEYTTSKAKVDIICKIHGVFKQQAGNHLQGSKCKKCADIENSINNKYLASIGCIFTKEGWINRTKNREGIFYILKCSNCNETFYKLGITSKSIKERYPSGRIAYNYEVIQEIKSNDLVFIWNLEKYFKKFIYINKLKYIPKTKFCGSSTECFRV